MAVNFAQPVTTRNYSTEFTQDIQNNIIGLSQLLDSTNTTITGTPPTYAKRINRSSGLFEEYNSTAWVSFTMGYLKVAGDTMTGVLTSIAASATGIILTRASGNTSGIQIGQTSVASWNIQNKATTGDLSFNIGAADLIKLTILGNLTISAPSSGSHTFNGTINFGTRPVFNGNTPLDSANYNSYAPTLTGTGASGEWNIKIGQGSIGDVNTALTANAGIVYFHNYVGTATNKPVTANNANGLLTFVTHPTGGSGSYGRQFAFPDTANIYTRSITNGTLNSWSILLDSANYNSYAPTLTGTGASGTWSINISGYSQYANPYAVSSASGVKTVRNVWANGLYSYSTISDGNAPTTYSAMVGFGAGTSGAGEIAVGWNGVANANGIWYRSLRDTTDSWSAWWKIVDSRTISDGTLNRVSAGYDSGATGSLNCNDYVRVSGSGGIYFATYGTGLVAQTSTYGSVMNYGTKGGYAGYALSVGSHNSVLMSEGSTTIGLYDHSNGWLWQGDFNGNITFSGNVTAYSDVRLKSNIYTIDNALNKVKNLRGVFFDWIKDGRRDTGIIAQEIIDVLPEVVSSSKEHLNDGARNILSINYGAIVGLLVEAIKELDYKIEILGNRE